MSKVCILMSTYNGEKYLSQQIDSIMNQTYKDIELFIRDDGSSDKTIQILEEYSRKFKSIIRFTLGENIGPAQSFLKLIELAPDADFYMFSDQDDYWLDNKVEKAIDSIKKFESIAMYYSNVTPVDYNLKKLSKNDIFLTGETDLYTLLIRNEIIGCTICINKLLKEIIIDLGLPNKMIMHDHWIGLVNAVFNGNAIFDKESYILYRQHNSNVVGSQRSNIELLKKHFHKKNRELRSNLVKKIVDSNVSLPIKDEPTIQDIYSYSKSLKTKFRLIRNQKLLKGSVPKKTLWIIDVLTNKY